MPEYSLGLIIIYRMSIVLVGFGFAFLGYRLFLKGVIDPAADFKGNWKEAKISLTQAAPGTFFALFGMILAAFGSFHSLNVNVDNDKMSYSISQSTSGNASPAISSSGEVVIDISGDETPNQTNSADAKKRAAD